MSSESASRSPSQTRSSGSNTVTPQQVTDPTILDSVAGFINEVVPATYSGPCDSKDQIQWARFEQIELDQQIYSDYEYDKIAPSVIILILGYTTGIQIWAIPATGEATEILSWRHGSVRVLKILPTPSYVGFTKNEDVFKTKRPLIALSDNSTPGPHFSSINFLSLKTGEQVKVIKFKNPVLDVLANKHSVVVTFQEKIAVFDAFTLEDRLTVTTCYLSPGLQPNPVTLGTRWMAYAEKKLNPSKRSSGGNDGEGVHSYTATVIQAAKSLGRGLRELGESVASSLTGNTNFKPGTSPNSPQAGGLSDIPQKGIVTVLDIENTVAQSKEKSIHIDAVVAHFTAHTEAIVCLQFDPSGMLLLTADKRGHDFHLFRIQPHPGGPALAAVHHLYVLHRGDTSARVQDMCFSPDSRWATVSTIRGTTHVFPVTPYGGNVGVRTHATPHVVNKMSRFHRSAGLTVDGRSNSPVSALEAPVNSHYPYHNPRFPPFPHPTVVHPLAQIRQPVNMPNMGNVPQRTQPGRQRLSSSSEDNIALRVVACFAPPRAWIDMPPRETTINKQSKPVESLFIMSCYGILVQYDLEPHQSSSVPKEKVCSDTPIELAVSARAQWLVQRQPNSPELPLPMTQENLHFFAQELPQKKNKPNHNDDQWLSQVEIVTHAGPHRRLWMGPQFTFKTYTTTTGSPMSLTEAQPIDLGHSKPVNMPITKANAVLIESSSASSCEQSLLDTYQRTFEEVGGAGELQLKEDLADAMLESPGIRETDPFIDMPDFKPVTESKSLKEAAKIPIPEPLKEIDTTLSSSNKDFHFELQSLDNEDFFSLENVSRADEFENVGESSENLTTASSKVKSKSNKSKSNKEKFQCFDDSSTNTSEDTAAEEKSVPKKARKPKAKLGVKIASISKDNIKTEKTADDCSAEITLPAPTKKSWSSVAASKPVVEQIFIDSVEKDLSLDLPKIEFVEEFTLQLPKKSSTPSVVADLIDINTPQEEKAKREESGDDIEEIICGNLDLLKIEKSSDDEKGDTSSSPAEITESDDSGKNPNIETVFEDLLNSTTVVPTSKSSRRKKRKK
ncbi:breast carcinoma-amplified sequence 3 homolog isoform X2 [Anoplophora glabripennis]|uniref:breast carcinoma-amplified sequence 3 homolog isoform X2 n=1 Tax=Anoplophora glabripennis TaxID=217634 RepID=UPI000873FAF9|nr:breast carcinoma-amplified sequence 3 homolog isoform X2 [Anoplophora glabripennis]